MRCLMKIVMPTASQNALMGEPQLDQNLRRLYAAAGGLEQWKIITIVVCVVGGTTCRQ